VRTRFSVHPAPAAQPPLATSVEASVGKVSPSPRRRGRDLSTGKRTPATTIRAHDPAGLRQSMFKISRDAKYYVHSYSRLLSGLLVVNGLK
jgi:hypothetical protein